MSAHFVGWGMKDSGEEVAKGVGDEGTVENNNASFVWGIIMTP